MSNYPLADTSYPQATRRASDARCGKKNGIEEEGEEADFYNG